MAQDTALSERYFSRYSSIRVTWHKIQLLSSDSLKIQLLSSDWLKIQLLPSDKAQNNTPPEWDGSRYNSFRVKWIELLLVLSDMAQDTAHFDWDGSIYSFWLLFGRHTFRILTMARTILTKTICVFPQFSRQDGMLHQIRIGRVLPRVFRFIIYCSSATSKITIGL